MPNKSTRRELSLHALELFRTCATKGSLQAAAEESGLSPSTVSHHLSQLEEALGVQLFDHARRPMQVTPTGRAFLRRIDGALHDIRTARAEIGAGDTDTPRYLRIGLVEDFDSDIAPHLAVHLAGIMPHCDFSYHTDASHAIIRGLRNRELDLGVLAGPAEMLTDLQSDPFLRDPFIVITPARLSLDPEKMLQGKAPLPFLRFTSNLFIGRQIEQHLRRLNVSLPNPFECANGNMLMAMVAAGSGWSITTALHYSRAAAFQSDVTAHRFPAKGFARTLSVVSTPDCSRDVVAQVRDKMTALLQSSTLPGLHDRLPWLKESFALIG